MVNKEKTELDSTLGLSTLLSFSGVLSKQPTGGNMFNLFRSHKREHNGIEALANELTYAIVDLRDDIKGLREEVDYLIEFLGSDD